MVDKTRKLVPSEVGYFDFEGMKVKAIIDSLKEKIMLYGPDIYVDKVYGSYGSSDYLAIHKMVPETDKQMTERIRKEEQHEANSREWELRQLKSLQAKYGDKLD